MVTKQNSNAAPAAPLNVLNPAEHHRLGSTIMVRLEEALAGVEFVRRAALHDDEDIVEAELACMMEMIARSLREGASLFDEYDTKIGNALRAPAPG